MNRRRTKETKSHSPAPFIALILLAVVGTFGGVLHAIHRNDQVNAERELVRIRERIEEHRLEIRMIEIRKERELDRYEIRARLDLCDSPLVAISHGVIERVRPLPGPDEPPVALRP